MAEKLLERFAETTGEARDVAVADLCAALPNSSNYFRSRPKKKEALSALARECLTKVPRTPTVLFNAFKSVGSAKTREFAGLIFGGALTDDELLGGLRLLYEWSPAKTAIKQIDGAAGLMKDPRRLYQGLLAHPDRIAREHAANVLRDLGETPVDPWKGSKLSDKAKKGLLLFGVPTPGDGPFWDRVSFYPNRAVRAYTSATRLFALRFAQGSDPLFRSLGHDALEAELGLQDDSADPKLVEWDPTVHERPRVLGKLSELGHHTTRVRKRVFLCDLAPQDAQVASVRISGFVRANLDAAIAEVAKELGVSSGRVEHTLFLPVRELDPLRRIARLHDCVLIAGPAETKLRATGIKASKTQLNLS
ncbi:MAG: hypothetical protein AAGE52_25790, partial [Myxococcota bacterium]